MAVQSDHSFRARLASILAVIVFAMAQLAAAAHAEDDHDPHASTVSCAICCLVAFDDDVDARPIVGGSILISRIEHSATLPLSQMRVVKIDSFTDVRGPPQS